MKLFTFTLLLCAAVSAWAQETPRYTISGGYVYMNADQHKPDRANYNGWYAIPQYHLGKGWSAIAEATGFYGSPGGSSTNIHSYTAGPLYAINTKTKVTPFLFGEAGAVRVSTPLDITHDFEFLTGVGANIALNSHWALQVIPGEYILTTPKAGPLHNFGAQAGFAFNFGSK